VAFVKHMKIVVPKEHEAFVRHLQAEGSLSDEDLARGLFLWLEAQSRSGSVRSVALTLAAAAGRPL